MTDRIVTATNPPSHEVWVGAEKVTFARQEVTAYNTWHLPTNPDDVLWKVIWPNGHAVMQSTEELTTSNTRIDLICLYTGVWPYVATVVAGEPSPSPRRPDVSYDPLMLPLAEVKVHAIHATIWSHDIKEIHP